MKRKPKSPRKKIEKRLDDLWKLCIKERANWKSEKSGNGGFMHAHHIHTRECRSTRWDLDNGICLNGGEHKWFHKYPLKAYRWLVAKKGQQFIDNLEIRANIIVKRTLEDLLWIEKELKIKLMELKKRRDNENYL